MSDETNAGAASAPMSPEAATAQKATLMADPNWRAAAMDSKGNAWATMTRLNEIIVAGDQTVDEAGQAEAALPPSNQATAPVQAVDDEGGDPEVLAKIHEVPLTPGGYNLPWQRAQELGLQTDSAKEIALAQAFHAAEVPKSLANTMYMAAITAAKIPEADRAISQASEYIKSEAALRKSWGASFDTNLATANAEARAIFEKLPPTLTKGTSFADWCRSSGIANNRVVVEALVSRAKARKVGS